MGFREILYGALLLKSVTKFEKKLTGFYMKVFINTVEPGYNDIGLCLTSSITSDILWY